MTPDEVKQLATDTFKEKVFYSTMIRDIDGHLLPSIFMMTAFMKEQQINQMKEDKVVAFYEYMEKASPRCINGYPMFMSMHMINGEDLKEVQRIVEKLTEATNAV